MSPVAINGVDKQGVYVNGVQVKQALDATNETVNKGVYDPTTLSAVDGDLAVGNIKDTVNIFGKLGTFVGGALVEDTKGTADWAGGTNTHILYNVEQLIASDTTFTVVTDTRDFDNSRAVIGFASGMVSIGAGYFKLRLIVDGVQEGETAYIAWSEDTSSNPAVLLIEKDLNGSITCKVDCHNYDITTRELYNSGFGLIIGAVKIA